MDQIQHDASKDWEKLLDPDTLKTNLVRASVYLASYELLKAAIVQNPRGFINMVNSDPSSDGQEYRKNVVSLCPKDRLHASCLWFQKMGAIDDADIAMIKEIRSHRNDIAHELPKYIGDSKYAVNIQLLDSIHFMIGKIERWWIREIEMEVNADYDHVDKSAVPDDQIHSGRMIMMDWIHKVICGQEDDLQRLLIFHKSLQRKNQGGDSNKPPERTR